MHVRHPLECIGIPYSGTFGMRMIDRQLDTGEAMHTILCTR
jgi:hypothetical protein